MEYFWFIHTIKSGRPLFQNLFCINLSFLSPYTVRLYHERVMMEVVGLCGSAIFICSRILITDLFHDLTWAKIVSSFIKSSSVRLISCFYFRDLPCWLPILKKALSDPSDKSLLIDPTLLLLLYLLEPILWCLVAPGRHSYLLELHVLLDPFNLRSDALSIFNVLLLLFMLNSRPFRDLYDLIVNEFRVLVHYIVLLMFFLSI